MITLAIIPFLIALGLYGFWTLIPRTPRSPYRRPGDTPAYTPTALRRGAAGRTPARPDLGAVFKGAAPSFSHAKRK